MNMLLYMEKKSIHSNASIVYNVKIILSIVPLTAVLNFLISFEYNFKNNISFWQSKFLNISV